MYELLNRIDEEIKKINGLENYINGNTIAYGVSIGLEKAKEIIKTDCCSKCSEDYE